MALVIEICAARIEWISCGRCAAYVECMSFALMQHSRCGKCYALSNDIYIYMYTYVFVHICIYMYSYVYAHIHIYTYICSRAVRGDRVYFIWYWYVCVHIYMYICAYVRVHTYVCIYICIHIGGVESISLHQSNSYPLPHTLLSVCAVLHQSNSYPLPLHSAPSLMQTVYFIWWQTHQLPQHDINILAHIPGYGSPQKARTFVLYIYIHIYIYMAHIMSHSVILSNTGVGGGSALQRHRVGKGWESVYKDTMGAESEEEAMWHRRRQDTVTGWKWEENVT